MGGMELRRYNHHYDHLNMAVQEACFKAWVVDAMRVWFHRESRDVVSEKGPSASGAGLAKRSHFLRHYPPARAEEAAGRALGRAKRPKCLHRRSLRTSW